MLAVEGLRIEREGVLLRSVTWRVEAGEHWVVLGANGSGKTSLLSALTGYLMPTAGTVEVLGERFGSFDWRELRRRVGLVSSSLSQRIEGMDTALEVVASGEDASLNVHGRRPRKVLARAGEVLERVGASGFSERPWRVLSQGERQRVLVGRALMAEPRLLILDEPCAGLDPVAREHFLGFLDALAGQARAPSLVLVTHHVEEIGPRFTHTLVLRAGEVLAAGPTAKTVASAVLSEAFGAALTVRRTRAGRYRLEVASGEDGAGGVVF